jgi:HK97 family phage prohead protease
MDLELLKYLQASIDASKNIAIEKSLKFQVEIKEADIVKKEADGKKVLVITGMASTMDIDRYDDVVHPMAFSGSLSKYMENPVVLLQHYQDKAIGKTISAQITEKGLQVTCEIDIDTEGVMEKIEKGVMRAFSIGFIVKAYQETAVGETEVRMITELDLVEISVVAVPANPKCLFTLQKGIKSLFLETKSAEDEPNDEQAPADEVAGLTPEEKKEE